VRSGMTVKGDEIFFWFCLFFHGTDFITESSSVQALINCFAEEADVS